MMDRTTIHKLGEYAVYDHYYVLADLIQARRLPHAGTPLSIMNTV